MSDRLSLCKGGSFVSPVTRPRCGPFGLERETAGKRSRNSRKSEPGGLRGEVLIEHTGVCEACFSRRRPCNLLGPGPERSLAEDPAMAIG